MVVPKGARPCLSRTSSSAAKRCKIARNYDPTAEISQPIDLVRKHANLEGSRFARKITPPSRRISARDRGVAPTFGGGTIGSDFTGVDAADYCHKTGGFGRLVSCV